MRKLGVGVLNVASAGNAYVYAATIFYIPFAVGGGFALVTCPTCPPPKRWNDS